MACLPFQHDLGGRRRRCLLVGLMLLGAALAACHQHDREGFDDIDPAARLQAIRAAAAERDANQLSDLIIALDSDDPAERLLAIRTLEELTGQTLGYDHAAPREDREAAAARWADWYHARMRGSSLGPSKTDGNRESATHP